MKKLKRMGRKKIVAKTRISKINDGESREIKTLKLKVEGRDGAWCLKIARPSRYNYLESRLFVK